jgi:tRNA nucleotidyltransferase (CCA-adding enzyme)
MVAVLSQVLQAVVTALRDAGGRPYVVGGGVRDRLLGALPKDDDVEVYGLAAERVREACTRVGRVEAVGAAFGVLKVTVGAETVDVSLPRRDSKTGPGHGDFAVATARDMPMAEAVRRRDFTVNALLLDPFTGALHDLVGGLGDLAERRLRAVDARLFGDDPLRALRACRLRPSSTSGSMPGRSRSAGASPSTRFPASGSVRRSSACSRRRRPRPGSGRWRRCGASPGSPSSSR